MNTQHLQYLIEIERTRSVSQAAENLFIGQPNLSRILHEMEASASYDKILGYIIKNGCFFLEAPKGYASKSSQP